MPGGFSGFLLKGPDYAAWILPGRAHWVGLAGHIEVGGWPLVPGTALRAMWSYSHSPVCASCMPCTLS